MTPTGLLLPALLLLPVRTVGPGPAPAAEPSPVPARLVAPPEPAPHRPSRDGVPSMRLVSARPDGRPAHGASGHTGLGLSADARWLVFATDADDLHPADENPASDVVLVDLVEGTTTLVSAGAGQAPAGGPCLDPDVSDDGRCVVFTAFATGLGPDDELPWGDVYLHDRAAGTTRCLSRAADGGPADGTSRHARVSGDGNLVVFESTADDLVPDDGDGVSDVFLVDRRDGSPRRVSAPRVPGRRGHAVRPVVSGDGSTIAFLSAATDLVPGDGNGVADVFVVDREDETCVRVNVTPAGGEADAGGGPSAAVALGHDGRHVAFVSTASNLVPGVGPQPIERIYVHDRRTGRTELATVAPDGRPLLDRCTEPSLSTDGRLVAFRAHSPTLAPDAVGPFTDVFVHDRSTDTTCRVSTPRRPGRGGDASHPVLSGDGTRLAFTSAASHLAPDDDDGEPDVFLAQRWRTRPGGCPGHD